MTSLQSHINSFNFSTQLPAIKNLINTAQVSTTFWGGRIIEINGFTGSVYLNDIAAKILDAGEQRCKADNLKPAERIAGIDTVRKLQHFYEVTDTQIKNSNFFTKFLSWIREFSFFIPYTTRFYLNESAESNFRAYTETKFLRQFGGSFNALMDHPASDGFFGPPSRVLAKDVEIRALFSRG